jgi:hypothetical protein
MRGSLKKKMIKTCNLDDFHSSNPSHSLVAGRTDGFGMMLCNLLYWSSIARTRQASLTGYWPATIPHLSTDSDCSLEKIFDPFSLYFKATSDSRLLKQVNTDCSTNQLVQALPLLRSEFLAAREQPNISLIIEKFSSYDYGIHARMGDVEYNPMLYGGGESRYYPATVYEKILDKIADEAPGSRVFLATNSRALINFSKRFQGMVETEEELLRSHGMNLSPKTMVGAWLIIRQLSKCDTIISPRHSSFSFLAQVSARQAPSHVTPGDFLGIESILRSCHKDYSCQASKLFLSRKLREQEAWTHLLLRGWSSVPVLTRFEISLKILLSL